MMRQHRRNWLAAIVAALLLLNARASYAQPWQVEVDPLTEMLDNFRDGLKQAKVNVPVMVEGVGFDISREGGHASEDQKKAMIGEWVGYLANELKTRRFKRAPGNPVDMREQIIRAQPFNQREIARKRMGDFVVLVNEESPPCNSDKGGMAAAVMAYYPTEDVRSDYGKIAVILIGVGECGRYRSANRNYMEQLTKRMEQLFKRQLGIRS